jgi:hypothetical protein
MNTKLVHAQRTLVTCLLALICTWAGSRAGGLCQAQSPAAAPAKSPARHYAVVQSGPHTRLWKDEAGHSVTEIGTGINYWDGQQWSPSDPTFQISADGTSFVAEKVQHQIHLNANLNATAAVTTSAPDGTTLKSTPLAIDLFDAATGNSLIIGKITNCTGIMVSSNEVVYSNAFTGVCADVVYYLDHGSFRQDVVFTGKIDPTDYNFPANTTHIRIITEFYDPPEPLQAARPVYVEQDQQLRNTMASPDIIDHTLFFGDLVFGPGRAFPAATTNTHKGFGTVVAKSWATNDNRTFLQESIPFDWVSHDLLSLPDCGTTTDSESQPEHQGKLENKKKFKVGLGAIPRPPAAGRPAHAVKAIPAKTKVASIKPVGFVMDYEVTLGDTPSVFACDTTYFVDADVDCVSNIVVEGGSVIKYPNQFYLIYATVVELGTAITFDTAPYRPAVFTASDDDSVGETLNGIDPNYTGNPEGNYYAAPALNLDSGVMINASNLRFCYAEEAISANPSAAVWTNVLTDAQFVNCFDLIEISGSHYFHSPSNDFETVSPNYLTFNNCLMTGVTNPILFFETSYTVMSLRNCTCDNISRFAYNEENYYHNYAPSNTAFNVTNCIFSNVGDWGTEDPGFGSISGLDNGFYNATEFGTSAYTNSSTPYQTVGAAGYYLADDSEWRDLGTTNISAGLLLDLQTKTTYPPVTNFYGWFTNDYTFFPQAQRDNSGSAVDLGYHYDPLDYALAIVVSNATLTVLPGTALAMFGTYRGIWLYSAGIFNCTGTAISPNYIVRYNTVQEQSNTNWETTSWGYSFLMPEYADSVSAANFGFTEWSVLGSDGQFSTSGGGETPIGFQDCQFLGGSNNISGETLYCTNCLFQRLNMTLSWQSGHIVSNTFCNNLLLEGELTFVHKSTDTNSWTFRDNLFDQTAITLTHTNSLDIFTNNAYVTTNYMLPASGGDQILSNSPAWESGDLGYYYYPTNQTNLIHTGSQLASAAGLYHYTVTTNNVIEGTNIVSIGFHYVACGTNGLPIDTNGDGIPDYLEDINGNGVVDSGEIDWQVAGDLGLTVWITQPANNSKIP